MARCRCGIELEAGWRFCKVCGAPSQVTATAAPSPERGAPERPGSTTNPGMPVRSWSSIRALPFWQKGGLGCGAVLTAIFLLAILAGFIDAIASDKSESGAGILTPSVSATVRPKYQLKISASPEGTEVAIRGGDGFHAVQTGSFMDFELEAGRYEMTARADGYEQYSGDVEVPKNKSLSVVLTREPAKQVVGSGSIGYLASDGPVLVGATEEANRRLTKLSVAHDHDGILQMIAQGQAALLKKRTQVRIIDQGVFLSEVRVLDGEFAGISVFVDSESIKER